jgi:hypothetical protein
MYILEPLRIDRSDVHSTLRLSLAVTVVCMVIAIIFPLIEPSLIRAVEDQFTVKQTVTAEISFQTAATDIIMSGSIAGITGGTSNGGTQVNVLTNNAAGYLMTIKASSSPAMQGDTQGGTIPNYTPTDTDTPDFAFAVGANTGEFAYTIEASTTADLFSKFLDDGAACGTGAGDTELACWYNVTTTPYTVINRSTDTANSGSTSTVRFRVQITANPSPAIPQDTYTATTTLTATTN